MIKYYLLCLVFTLLGAFGALFFKKATQKGGNFLSLLFCPSLYIGGLFYVAGAVLNIITLKHLKYTVVLPMTSITYIWTFIISYLLFNEKITNKKLIGIILIILGAISISV